MSKKLNILLITSDQQRGDCFGFEGRNVKTPHLDEMARTGTRFATCITPNVVCQPSRASILTGLLPRTHGVSDNGIDLDESVGAAGFAGQFAKAGYKTGFLGKAHFSTFHTPARRELRWRAPSPCRRSWLGGGPWQWFPGPAAPDRAAGLPKHPEKLHPSSVSSPPRRHSVLASTRSNRVWSLRS